MSLILGLLLGAAVAVLVVPPRAVTAVQETTHRVVRGIRKQAAERVSDLTTKNDKKDEEKSE